MGEVHRLPNPQVTEREASDWFARLNADDVTAEDHAQFEVWVAAHPCNAKAYAELLGTWNELVRSGPLVRAVSFGQVMNAAAARSVRRPRWLAGALAATLAVISNGRG
jgi:ferric-dicitrate binding protein FerR (iron transport regulator)